MDSSRRRSGDAWLLEGLSQAMLEFWTSKFPLPQPGIDTGETLTPVAALGIIAPSSLHQEPTSFLGNSVSLLRPQSWHCVRSPPLKILLEDGQRVRYLGKQPLSHQLQSLRLWFRLYQRGATPH